MKTSIEFKPITVTPFDTTLLNATFRLVRLTHAVRAEYKELGEKKWKTYNKWTYKVVKDKKYLSIVNVSEIEIPTEVWKSIE